MSNPQEVRANNRHICGIAGRTEIVISISKKEFRKKYVLHNLMDSVGTNWFCPCIQDFFPKGFEIHSHEVCEQFVNAAPQCFGEGLVFPCLFITSALKDVYFDMGVPPRMALLDQIPDDYMFTFIGHAVNR